MWDDDEESARDEELLKRRTASRLKESRDAQGKLAERFEYERDFLERRLQAAEAALQNNVDDGACAQLERELAALAATLAARRATGADRAPGAAAARRLPREPGIIRRGRPLGAQESGADAGRYSAARVESNAGAADARCPRRYDCPEERADGRRLRG